MVPINRLKRWPFPGDPAPEDRQSLNDAKQRTDRKSRRKPTREKGADGDNNRG